ncbi:MAG TPA: hypothetical protein VGE59_01180 [Patescibacteria group bacterium]
MTPREPLYPNQVIPLVITALVCAFGVAIVAGEIFLLNTFVPQTASISLVIRWPDVLVGLTIYLKTAIDFAIFMGRLMDSFRGWKNRIAIEIGSALGNILGTVLILLIWTLFKEVTLLMVAMIAIASLVLLRMAEEGLEHVKDSGNNATSLVTSAEWLERVLQSINKIFAPLLRYIIPEMKVSGDKNKSWWGLFGLAFSVPFILGLDDFAGYVPLFNIINVFGFATGVFLGHMILNIALFISPDSTIRIVKHPVISFIGSLAFIGLAVWGLYEGYHLLATLWH